MTAIAPCHKPRGQCPSSNRRSLGRNGLGSGARTSVDGGPRDGFGQRPERGSAGNPGQLFIGRGGAHGIITQDAQPMQRSRPAPRPGPAARTATSALLPPAVLFPPERRGVIEPTDHPRRLVPTRQPQGASRTATCAEIVRHRGLARRPALRTSRGAEPGRPEGPSPGSLRRNPRSSFPASVRSWLHQYVNVQNGRRGVNGHVAAQGVRPFFEAVGPGDLENCSWT